MKAFYFPTPARYVVEKEAGVELFFPTGEMETALAVLDVLIEMYEEEGVDTLPLQNFLEAINALEHHTLN